MENNALRLDDVESILRANWWGVLLRFSIEKKNSRNIKMKSWNYTHVTWIWSTFPITKWSMTLLKTSLTKCNIKALKKVRKAKRFFEFVSAFVTFCLQVKRLSGNNAQTCYYNVFVNSVHLITIFNSLKKSFMLYVTAYGIRIYARASLFIVANSVSLLTKENVFR